MKMFLRFVPLALIYSFAFASELTTSGQETYLSPLDFGLSLRDHGMVDYCDTPPNIRVGNYNSDDYPDIARFNGGKLEIFLCTVNGYTSEPQMVKEFDKPIKTLGFGGTVWDTHPPLKVIFSDGTEELFHLRRGCLNLNSETYNSQPARPPRTIEVADFEIVWESEEYPNKVNECIVGDVDGDGIMEFISSWKENNWADTVHILIYKNSGDNTYELFMEEDFYDPIAGSCPATTFFLITDIDQNGKNELLFTYDSCYLWEFSAPGEYTRYRSNFVFPRAVSDAEITDVDQDSVLEFTTVMNTPDLTPPCAYWVCEFEEKDTVDFMMNFDIISGFWQNWSTGRIAVGDFDNDGAVDIVQGNAYIMSPGYTPDVRYYRHIPGSSGSFEYHQLVTNLPIGCVTPIIEDIDGDGDLDLYVGGPTYGNGAAFLWEGTGLQSGYVVWVDTLSALGSPDFSYLGNVDDVPSIVSSCTPTVAPTTTSTLYLWQWDQENNRFVLAWETPYLYNSDYRMPHLADMDGDGKVSILLVDDDNNKMIDWEQLSTGVWENPHLPRPQTFKLYTNYPNPFNSSTVIPFEISKKSDIRLSVYDIFGRIVYEYDEEDLLPGHYAIDWDASGLSSGIYFIKLQIRDEQQVMKGVLLK